MPRNEDLEMLRRHVDQLGEHFDTVMIFTTRHEAGTRGGTVNAHWGSGNWFARYGQIRHWLIKEDEGAKCEPREDRDRFS